MLFVYGSLLDAKVQQEVFGELIPGVSGILLDYHSAQDSGDYPFIVKKPGTSVKGLVLNLTQAQEALAKEYEGELYTSSKVKVVSKGNMVEVDVYTRAHSDDYEPTVITYRTYIEDWLKARNETIQVRANTDTNVEFKPGIGIILREGLSEYEADAMLICAYDSVIQDYTKVGELFNSNKNTLMNDYIRGKVLMLGGIPEVSGLLHKLGEKWTEANNIGVTHYKRPSWMEYDLIDNIVNISPTYESDYVELFVVIAYTFSKYKTSWSFAPDIDGDGSTPVLMKEYITMVRYYINYMIGELPTLVKENPEFNYLWK